MNTTKRIEYIDALRGFTMILVVTGHIFSDCFMHEELREHVLSYYTFFGIFRMPLFYFISGFVFFKIDRYWDYATFKSFMSSKTRVQIFSTLIFFLLYCWLYQKDIVNSLFDLHKSGYWFTYALFVYFLLYIGIDKTICWLSRKKTFNSITIITSFIVGILLYFFINNGFLLNILSPQMTSLLSISKWQFFIYFSFGCCIHKYYDAFLNLQKNNYVKDTVLLLFVCFSIIIFYHNNFMNIFRLIAASFGILLVMFIFKENESYLSSSTKLGTGFQYIGKHTLDIYFLHFFFLPYNLSFVGRWLEKNPNPLLEFCMSLTLALIVIGICLLVSKIIRLSPTLAYLLLGGKRIKQI